MDRTGSNNSPLTPERMVARRNQLYETKVSYVVKGVEDGFQIIFSLEEVMVHRAFDVGLI